jgi:hypothetical protein
MLAPHADSQLSSEVGSGATVGTLQTGYPMYRLQDKTRSMTSVHALPHALQLQTLPRCRGEL